MHRKTGIVLQYRGRNISVLEMLHGRVDAFLYSSPFAKSRVQRGSVISYYAEKDRYQNLLFDHVEIEHVPLEWGRNDIYFLHNMLELCYYFVPQGVGCDFVFSFFMTLFKEFSFFISPLHKKIVLCKLFSQLGMYPYVPEIQI